MTLILLVVPPNAQTLAVFAEDIHDSLAKMTFRHCPIVLNKFLFALFGKSKCLPFDIKRSELKTMRLIIVIVDILKRLVVAPFLLL